MFCDRLAIDLWPGRDRLELPVSLGKSVHEIKNLRVTGDRFTTVPNDIRGNWVNYDLQRLATKGGSSCKLGHLQVKLTSSTTVLTVKSNCGACQFQWRVGPSYCKYAGVTYDLLVSNIGGTCDLADQLPSNREFGHFLVVSQSQVPRVFDENPAQGSNSQKVIIGSGNGLVLNRQ